MPPFAGEVGRGGLLLTREQACGVEIALLDAEEIAREALAKHLRELGEDYPSAKITAEWLRACIAGFERARASLHEAASSPNIEVTDAKRSV